MVGVVGVGADGGVDEIVLLAEGPTDWREDGRSQPTLTISPMSWSAMAPSSAAWSSRKRRWS